MKGILLSLHSSLLCHSATILLKNLFSLSYLLLKLSNITNKQKQTIERMQTADSEIKIGKEKKVRINGRYYSSITLVKNGFVVAVVNHQGTCGGNVSALS